MIKTKFGSFLLLCITMLLPVFAAAQDAEERSYLSVRRVTVHTAGTDTWLAQQVKMAEARKESGSGARHVWQEVAGDLEAFHIVTFSDAIGGGGGNQNGPLGDAQAEWLAVTGPTIESRSTTILRHYPGLSIPGREDDPFIVLRYTYVAPGKNGAFQSWIREKLVPALKAGGGEGFNFNRIAYGGDTNQWVSASRISSPADLNEPGPLSHLSDEERDALFEGWGDMVWGSEVRILRYRADLSNEAPED